MNHSEDIIAILNDLLRRESESVLPRLVESDSFISWSSADEGIAVNRMVDEHNIRAMFFTDDGKSSFVPPIAGIALVNICAAVLLAFGVLFITQPRNAAQACTQHLFVPSALRAIEPVQADAAGLNLSTGSEPGFRKPTDS